MEPCWKKYGTGGELGRCLASSCFRVHSVFWVWMKTTLSAACSVPPQLPCLHCPYGLSFSIDYFSVYVLFKSRVINDRNCLLYIKSTRSQYGQKGLRETCRVFYFQNRRACLQTQVGSILRTGGVKGFQVSSRGLDELQQVYSQGFWMTIRRYSLSREKHESS